jgi:hypothetical protein
MIDITRINSFNFTKVFVVLVIVLVTTNSISTKIIQQYIDNQLTKTILLLMIVLVLYYDIHLGLLLLTLFIIILVQLSQSAIKEAHVKVEMFRMNQNQNNASQCDFGEKQKDELSADHVEYILDDKVKPYDVFIKMITSKNHLDLASNAAILQ